jgi:hypothetical protein
MDKDIINKNDKNQLHGIQIGYYDDNPDNPDNPGQIMYEDNYINGYRHGIQIGYHVNGQISYKEYYINGQYHGERIG